MPRAHLIDCYYCGRPVDTSKPGVYQAVRGWAQLRTGGGTNAVALRETLRYWACKDCIIQRSAGTVQRGLF
jgi:hypothetical protein